MQGDFDYSQLTFPTEAGLYVEEKKEDISGVGDSLDKLMMDVLPGKDGAAEAQAQEFADEIMVQDDSPVQQKGPQSGAGQGDEELQIGDISDDEQDNIIDF